MYRPGFVTPLPVPESTLVGLAVRHLGVPCTCVVLNATVYVTSTTKGLCHKTQTSTQTQWLNGSQSVRLAFEKIG